MDEFQQAWIQPESGVERPIVFISPVVIPLVVIPPVAKEQASLLNAEVRVRGVYLKRLAYRSSIGADLAPVLVGTIARSGPVRATSDIANHRFGAQNNAASMTMAGISVTVWLAIALLVGIGIAALIMTSSRRSAKRLQSIRNHMPATLPTGLPTVGEGSDD